MFKLEPYWVDPERFGPSLRAPLLLLSQVSILNDAMANKLMLYFITKTEQCFVLIKQDRYCIAELKINQLYQSWGQRSVVYKLSGR
jgi:hypothetical protein